MYFFVACLQNELIIVFYFSVCKLIVPCNRHVVYFKLSIIVFLSTSMFYHFHFFSISTFSSSHSSLVTSPNSQCLFILELSFIFFNVFVILLIFFYWYLFVKSILLLHIILIFFNIIARIFYFIDFSYALSSLLLRNYRSCTRSNDLFMPIQHSNYWSYY